MTQSGSDPDVASPSSAQGRGDVAPIPSTVVSPWHARGVGLGLLLVFLFPVGLYFMWRHGAWTLVHRVAITIIGSCLLLVGILSDSARSEKDSLDRAAGRSGGADQSARDGAPLCSLADLHDSLVSLPALKEWEFRSVVKGSMQMVPKGTTTVGLPIISGDKEYDIGCFVDTEGRVTCVTIIIMPTDYDRYRSLLMEGLSKELLRVQTTNNEELLPRVVAVYERLFDHSWEQVFPNGVPGKVIEAIFKQPQDRDKIWMFVRGVTMYSLAKSVAPDVVDAWRHGEPIDSPKTDLNREIAVGGVSVTLMPPFTIEIRRK